MLYKPRSKGFVVCSLVMELSLMGQLRDKEKSVWKKKP